MELNFSYVILKQRAEYKKMYDETMQDLDMIMFQLFRKPEERLAQLMEAERYLSEKIDYFKDLHKPKYPYIQCLERYFPFNEELMELLTEKLVEIKFEIQSIREQIQKETQLKKKPKTKVEDKLKQKDMSCEIKDEDNLTPKEQSMTYVGSGTYSPEFCSLKQTLENILRMINFIGYMVLGIFIIHVIIILSLLK